MEIVVGIDGSVTSNEALDFACEEAKLRQANLKIVHAWDLVYDSDVEFSGADFRFQIETQAQSLLDAAAKHASDRCGDHVTITKRLIPGSAAPALLEEAKNADLIVVGSRGRGGFASLILGSTSHQVLNHARSPVVVVRKSDA